MQVSDGKQFHSLTVDIKYEEEKETVLAKGIDSVTTWRLHFYGGRHSLSLFTQDGIMGLHRAQWRAARWESAN